MTAIPAHRAAAGASSVSVAPSEIEHLDLAEALFLRKYGASGL
jgi:hypothetical protein